MKECRLVKKNPFDLFTDFFQLLINILNSAYFIVSDIHLFIYFPISGLVYLLAIGQLWADTAGIKLHFRIRADTNKYCSRSGIRASVENISNSPNNVLLQTAVQA